MNTENQIDDVEEKRLLDSFSKRRKLQFIVYGLVMILIVIIAVTKANASIISATYSYWILGIVAATVVFSFFNWRCPACKRYLGRGISPKHCPGCGIKLQK